MKVFNIKFINIAFVFLLVLFISLLSSATIFATDINVIGNGFVDIQNSIDSANSGDVVQLGNKTYTGIGIQIKINEKNNFVIRGLSNSSRANLDAKNLARIFSVSNCSVVTFKYINFINANSSINSGAAIMAYSTIIVEDCSFSDNYGASGTAIYLNGSAENSVIINSEFINNRGIYHNPLWDLPEGGAVDSHASNTIIKSCLFKNNAAIGIGGAVNFAFGINNQLISSIFINNSASKGGALSIRSASLEVSGCDFTNNIADYGSAIYNDNNLLITRSTFSNNLAKAFDIIAPEAHVIHPNNVAIDISLVCGDNVLDAIYNIGNINIDGSIPKQLSSSPNQKITLILNGAMYIAYTNTNGVASFNISTILLSVKTYEYAVTFIETLLYTGITKNSILIVALSSNSGSSNNNQNNQGSTSNTNRTKSISKITGISYWNIWTKKTTRITENYMINKKGWYRKIKGIWAKVTKPKPSGIWYKLINSRTNKWDKVSAYIKSNSNSTLYYNKVYTSNKRVLKPYTKSNITTITTLDGKKISEKKQYNVLKEATTSIYFISSLTSKEKKKYIKYLKSSKNCQVNNSIIKKQVINIIGKVEGELIPNKKANALFNWLRNRNNYNYYNNTRYGALTSLLLVQKGRVGQDIINCADHSHLLIALLRTAGIPSIYEHGQCKFRNGQAGHYWPKASINGKWYKLDPVSIYNGFNSVTWKLLYMKGRYYSLSNSGTLKAYI